MCKFDHNDWDILVYEEEVRDGFIFGNYVEWGSFRKNNEEELLSYFEVKVPWGEEITLKEYIEFMEQDVFKYTSIISKYDLNDLLIIRQGNSLSKIRLKFPNREDNNSDDIISEIFDYYEIPLGTAYEHELPEDLQYWHRMYQMDLFEYEYYQNYPLEFKNYQQTVSKIHLEINNSKNILIKKSLLLSSFIISESLLKSAIINNIPKENHINEFNKKILSEGIDSKLRGNVDKRNNLFKQLFNQKPPKQEWIALRNALAHDIESPKIVNDKVIYINLKDDEEYTISISELFQKQNDFYEELKRIIDNYNLNNTYT